MADRAIETSHGERKGRDEHDHRATRNKKSVARLQRADIVLDVLQDVERHQAGVVSRWWFEDVGGTDLSSRIVREPQSEVFQAGCVEFRQRYSRDTAVQPRLRVVAQAAAHLVRMDSKMLPRQVGEPGVVVAG